MNNKRIFTVNFICDADDIGRYQKMVDEMSAMLGTSYLNTEIRFATDEEKDLARVEGIIQE